MICVRKIGAAPRDHDRNMDSWCIRVRRGVESFRLFMDDIAAIRELSRREGHHFQLQKVKKETGGSDIRPADNTGMQTRRTRKTPGDPTRHKPEGPFTECRKPVECPSMVFGVPDETAEARNERIKIDALSSGVAKKPLLDFEKIPNSHDYRRGMPGLSSPHRPR